MQLYSSRSQSHYAVPLWQSVLVLTGIQTFSTHTQMFITCSSSYDGRLPEVLHHVNCNTKGLLVSSMSLLICAYLKARDGDKTEKGQQRGCKSVVWTVQLYTLSRVYMYLRHTAVAAEHHTSQDQVQSRHEGHACPQEGSQVQGLHHTSSR